MFTIFLLMTLLPAVSSIIATSTTVIPLYDDEGSYIVDTLTKFNLKINWVTFLLLPITILPSLIITLEVGLTSSMILISLIMTAIIDLRFKLIPNRFVILLIILVSLYLFVGNYLSWVEISLRVGLAFVLFILLIIIAVITNGSIGGADVKILPLVIIVLSTNEVLVFMVLICVLALLTFLLLALLGKRDMGIPVIPFVAVSFAITSLYGEQLYSLYEEVLYWSILSYT